MKKFFTILEYILQVYFGGAVFWIFAYILVSSRYDTTTSIILVSSSATVIGALLGNAEIERNNKEKEEAEGKERAREIAYRNWQDSIERKDQELKKRKIETEQRIQELYEEFVAHIEKEQKQTFPYLAQQVADFEYANDLKVSKRLLTKKRPAKSSAEEVKKIAAEKRELKRKCKEYEYQLCFLENMFPWISSYKKAAPAKAAAYVASADSNYDSAREYLSPEEYAELSSVEKSTLAMERWKKRKKDPWEAGILYERYIGYLYENNGYTVEYVGALRGKEDRGIDLIAKKGNAIEIVQCKRYSAAMSKFVRENTVAQLFGVTAVYNMENPKKHAKGVIYTSSTLSEEAKHFAEYLKIEVIDNKPLPKEYPTIKCNVGKDGEKIYHLPFDQQYDKIKIAGKKDAMYCLTPSEAEQMGFRRAKKWMPEQAQK